MSVIDEALSAILKGANPSASDEDIASQVAGLKQTGGDAVNQALSFIPGMNTAKDIVSNAPALANTEPVQAMAKGLTGEPISSSLPNPGNPVSDVVQGTLSGLVPSQTPPAPSSPAPVMPPPPEATQLPVSTPASAPVDSSKSAASLSPVKSTEDERKRNQMLEDEKKRHLLGTIPVALGGIGDAIQNAGVTFGGPGSKGTAETLSKENQATTERNKADFELKLKNDPNSDVSKSYRQMVSQIVPDLAKNADFQKMTAQEIGEKLPLIDTMMRAKAEEITKQYMLQNQKFYKDQALEGKAQNAFNSDKVVTNAQGMNAALRKADTLLASGQPIPPDMIGLIMAPAITGVKRFNSTELAAFHGEKNIPGKIAQVMKEATTGKFTGNNKQIYQTISQGIQKQNNQDLQERGVFHAKQLASQTGKDWKQHYQDITTEPYKESPTPASTGSLDARKARVRGKLGL